MPRQSQRRHQQGEESRQRILDAAFEIASERGYDGTTLALVTKRAGLPASSVYWQFKNKDELLAEAIEHNYRQWRASRTSWTELADNADLDVQVETALRNLATGLVDQPSFQRLGLMLALERRAVEASARARFRKVRDDTIMMMTGWWHRVLPSSAIAAHPQAPHELAQMMIAVSDGLFIATQTDEGFDHARLVELMTIGMRGVVHHFLAAAGDEDAAAAAGGAGAAPAAAKAAPARAARAKTAQAKPAKRPATGSKRSGSTGADA
ncbi:TetR/AcrR family transcriptional regulator [Actinoallomurus sp. CA-142502]|uniref:TetR/AcrR family transcriptional regulator n=1 Tax=Actinoallomurus sp. CA-142502 TaxID=3239885 RepID=UPI003D8F7F92